jgi:hypothetical protein
LGSRLDLGRPRLLPRKIGSPVLGEAPEYRGFPILRSSEINPSPQSSCSLPLRTNIFKKFSFLRVGPFGISYPSFLTAEVGVGRVNGSGFSRVRARPSMASSRKGIRHPGVAEARPRENPLPFTLPTATLAFEKARGMFRAKRNKELLDGR